MKRDNELRDGDKKDDFITKRGIEEFTFIVPEGYTRETMVAPPVPRCMNIEMTNACNLNCIFCYHQHTREKRHDIDPALCKKIIKDAYDLGVRELGLYLLGESLLNKNLEDYAKFAKDMGYEYIFLTTNGVYADEDRLTRMVEAGFDSFKFSINAATRETYKKIHGKDVFDRVIANLRFLHNLRKSRNLSYGLYVTCAVTKHSMGELDIYMDTIGRLVDHVTLNRADPLRGLMMENLDIDPGPDPRFAESIITLPCGVLFTRVFVTHEGYLDACCSDFNREFIMADLNQVELKDAWNGEKFQELRRRHLNRDVEGLMCAGCIKNYFDDSSD